MKTAWLAACALMAMASAAHAADYGLLGPTFGKGAVSPALKAAIVSRANATLDRPPGAIPHAHTEGTLPGKGIREISIKAREDQPIVLNFALAYRLTGDRRFLEATGRYLENWADIYQISFNPIDETGFDTLVMATDLTESDLPARSAPRSTSSGAGWRSAISTRWTRGRRTPTPTGKVTGSRWRPWPPTRPATPS